MDTFNKKSLCVALAATGVLGAAGVAQAVNVSADTVGQVLIYPYYTVNKDVNGNTFNTLMSVVNTTLSTKAIKVRFREGKNSEEVLDFNVFLSPYDVWTAAITPVAAGGAQISTSDKSCTIPGAAAFPAAFRTGAIADSDNGIARTQEGYFEIFEMATYQTGSVVDVNAKHSNGVPKDCSKITDATAGATTPALEVPQPPNGGLKGDVTIYSPAGGGMFARPAVALENFSNAGSGYQPTTSALPTYSQATPPVSNVVVGTDLVRSTWPAGTPLAVTAALMADRVANQYALESAARAQSTWILTFPTKQPHVNGATAPIAPFTSKYVTKVGACENFFGIVFDREESQPTAITGTDFSPVPTPGAGPQLCWEAQSVGFGTTTTGGSASSNIFGSANHNSIATPYVTGWALLAFNSLARPNEHSLVNSTSNARINLSTGAVTTPAAVTYFGLPVIGFAAQTQENQAIVVGGKTYLSTFGSTSPLRHVRSVQ